MSEVMVAEKAGMLVGGNKEDGFNVVGWVLAGDEYDCNEDETLVTHHKTAEKFGLGDVFKEMKAENAPAKAPKVTANGEAKVRGPRKAVPKEGTYTVLKPETLIAAGKAGKEVAQILADNTDLATFFAQAPEKFTQEARDGTSKEFATVSFVGYAIKRGMISIDA
jgi:hypothetical protein